MKKIVLTGGPSGGKTTALSILKETFGKKNCLGARSRYLNLQRRFPAYG